MMYYDITPRNLQNLDTPYWSTCADFGLKLPLNKLNRVQSLRQNSGKLSSCLDKDAKISFPGKLSSTKSVHVSYTIQRIIHRNTHFQRIVNVHANSVQVLPWISPKKGELKSHDNYDSTRTRWLRKTRWLSTFLPVWVTLLQIIGLLWTNYVAPKATTRSPKTNAVVLDACLSSNVLPKYD